MRMCRVVGASADYREISKLAAIDPRDHHQRSHWLLPSDRFAYSHVRATTTIHTPALEQPSFSNVTRRTRRSDYEFIYNN